MFIPKDAQVDRKTGSLYQLDENHSLPILPQIIDVVNRLRVLDPKIGGLLKTRRPMEEGEWKNYKETYFRLLGREAEPALRHALTSAGVEQSAQDLLFELNVFNDIYTDISWGNRVDSSIITSGILYAISGYAGMIDRLSQEGEEDELNSLGIKREVLIPMATSAISSQEYWEGYFAEHPEQKPSKIVYYTGDPSEALERWKVENGITKILDNHYLDFPEHFVLKDSPQATLGISRFRELAIPYIEWYGKTKRIVDHLSDIDPVLAPFAGRFSRPPSKDLSTPERFINGEYRLEPSDLVAIHLTNTFPENGIIHPRAYYQPDTLRFTTHFVINAMPPRINLLGWNWEQRKYAVLVPFDKIKDRVLAFNPADTFVLEDLDLPEGTVILRDKNDTTLIQNAGKAQVIEVDYSRDGEKINGFHRAVYEQMIGMGYFPQAVGERGDYYGWDLVLPDGRAIHGRDVLEEFCARKGLEFAKGNPHASHWTGQIEDIAFDLRWDRAESDQEGLAADMKRGNTFIQATHIPEKYKQALAELVARQR